MTETPKEMRKHRQQSLQALPVYIVIFIVLAGLLFAAHAFLRLPLWFVWLILGFQAFYIAIDVVNVLYLGRKLK